MNASFKFSIIGYSVILLLSLVSPVSLLLFGNNDAYESYKKKRDRIFEIDESLKTLPQESPGVMSLKQKSALVAEEIERSYLEKNTLTWWDWIIPLVSLLCLCTSVTEARSEQTRSPSPE